MANNRPIRRGRFPRFRRGRRTPVRWLDASLQSAGAECPLTPWDINCEPWTPGELLVGDIDLDWLDKNAATVQRLVGTITVTTEDANSAGLPATTLVRLGMLQTEDTDRLYQTIDLFDSESLEQFEWMWLHQLSFASQNMFFNPTQAGSPIWIRKDSVDIPVDVRTKRKLGQKDSVVLYMQKRRVTAALGANDTSITRAVHQLRSVVAV